MRCGFGMRIAPRGGRAGWRFQTLLSAFSSAANKLFARCVKKKAQKRFPVRTPRLLLLLFPYNVSAISSRARAAAAYFTLKRNKNFFFSLKKQRATRDVEFILFARQRMAACVSFLSVSRFTATRRFRCGKIPIEKRRRRRQAAKTIIMAANF